MVRVRMNAEVQKHAKNWQKKFTKYTTKLNKTTYDEMEYFAKWIKKSAKLRAGWRSYGREIFGWLSGGITIPEKNRGKGKAIYKHSFRIKTSTQSAGARREYSGFQEFGFRTHYAPIKTREFEIWISGHNVWDKVIEFKDGNKAIRVSGNIDGGGYKPFLRPAFDEAVKRADDIMKRAHDKAVKKSMK